MTDADHVSNGIGSSPPGHIGTTSAGLALSSAFFLFGAVNYYLIPVTGGLASYYWTPILYDLLLNRYFLVLVYIPSIQLPLATVYFLRSRDRHRKRILSPEVVVGLFGIVAVVQVALVIAGAGSPWDAGSLQWAVDAVLFQELVGGAGIPEIVNTVYVFYFPVAVLAVLLADRFHPPGNGAAGAPVPRSPTEVDGPDAATDDGRVALRARSPVSGLPRMTGPVPYWGLVAGVGLILVAGLATGGLETAIGIASLVLSLYQLQPEDDA